jgi:hypothetical protein
LRQELNKWEKVLLDEEKRTIPTTTTLTGTGKGRGITAASVHTVSLFSLDREEVDPGEVN